MVQRFFFSFFFSLVFRERKKERTDIKLSGLDNAGNSVPFLHGLDFREISSSCSAVSWLRGIVYFHGLIIDIFLNFHFSQPLWLVLFIFKNVDSSS
jgi:hypothetical protein